MWPAQAEPPNAVAGNEASKKDAERKLMDKVVSLMGKLNFLQDAMSMFFCARDAETPGIVKVALFGALAYFLLPLDIIPDAVPIMGFTDDAAIISSALFTFGKYITDEHRARARRFLTVSR